MFISLFNLLARKNFDTIEVKEGGKKELYKNCIVDCYDEPEMQIFINDGEVVIIEDDEVNYIRDGSTLKINIK